MPERTHDCLRLHHHIAYGARRYRDRHVGIGRNVEFFFSCCRSDVVRPTKFRSLNITFQQPGGKRRYYHDLRWRQIYSMRFGHYQFSIIDRDLSGGGRAV